MKTCNKVIEMEKKQLEEERQKLEEEKVRYLEITTGITWNDICDDIWRFPAYYLK